MEPTHVHPILFCVIWISYIWSSCRIYTKWSTDKKFRGIVVNRHELSWSILGPDCCQVLSLTCIYLKPEFHCYIRHIIVNLLNCRFDIWISASQFRIFILIFTSYPVKQSCLGIDQSSCILITVYIILPICWGQS